MSRDFRFRDFTLKQERSAMKAGTDNVLFAAWASEAVAGDILDAGAGTGLISLISAAAHPRARITAVEIDPEAAAEAAGNFAASPWADRLRLVCSDLSEFISTTSEAFDHVICNPPFFPESTSAPDPGRQRARHSMNMPPEMVFSCAEVLRKEGRLSLLIPYRDRFRWIREAASRMLFVEKRAAVVSTEGRDPHRLMLRFGSGPVSSSAETITVQKKDGGYSERYAGLVSGYYPAGTISFSVS